MRNCSIDGCESPHLAQGWCRSHYDKWRRNGDPLNTRAKPVSERFWKFVQKTDDCWNWTSTKNNRGYGQIHSIVSGKRVVKYAHRVSYEIHNGEIPSGLFVDHMCFNPACVNPEHLRLLSNQENGINRAGLNKNNVSGYRGVWFDKSRNRWCASVTIDYIKHFIGRYTTKEEAIVAVQEYRRIHAPSSLHDIVDEVKDA